MVDAIVLAGGEGRRLGGLSKPDVTVGGRRMLDIVLDAVAHARTRVVVAAKEVAVPDGVVRTLEDPPYGGPSAGIAAGLAALEGARGAGPDGSGSGSGAGAPAADAEDAEDEEVLVLACDLPGADSVVAALGSAGPIPPGADGVVLTRPDGSRDWLALRARPGALRRALELIGDPRGRSVRDLLAPLALVDADGPGARAEDVDTPEDRRRWEQRAGRRERPPVTERADWPTVLGPWLDDARSGLGLGAGDVDVDAVHRLTGEVAEGVQRSMAPVASYLVGVAVGRGMSFEEAAAAVRRTLPR